MDKSESQLLKGIAILMMIFLHLFNNADFTSSQCINLIFVRGIPLASWLTAAMSPVALFIFLSGYGLYKSEGRKEGRKEGAKVLQLYLSYWLVSLVFVSIGHFIKPIKYPGDWIDIIKNLTGFTTSYNPEMWFLLPYSVLYLSHKYLFRLLDRYNIWGLLVVVFCITFGSGIICTRYIDFLVNNRAVYTILLCVNLTFPFLLGAAISKYNVIERWKNYSNMHLRITTFAPLLLILIVIGRCLIASSLASTPYLLGIVCTIVVLRMPFVIKRSLITLGKYSMWIWMVHTYYCVYLFRDYCYALKYPILIFIAVTVVSYLTALMLESLMQNFNRVKVLVKE